MNTHSDQTFRVFIASNESERRAAFALRYDVFIEEMGGSGPLVDHNARQERDRFDDFFDHILLWDDEKNRLAGVYRVLRSDQAHAAGQFYSEDEFDLSLLKATGRRLLELGRSCLHADYRGGPGMFHLWNGLATYIQQHEIEILFGVASFHGTDTGALAQPLSLLHERHLAPEPLRVKARPPHAVAMNILENNQIDRRAAMMHVPALIKAYLRLGGVVGQDAYVDHDFNTVDVCLIMDTNAMSDRQKRIYGSRE